MGGPMLLRPTCEAMTLAGAPCRCVVHATLDLGERGPRGLCQGHARMARRGPLALWEPRVVPPATRSPAVAARWSPEDDAFLREHPRLSTPVAAAHLGRTSAAVHQKRKRSRLGG